MKQRLNEITENGIHYTLRGDYYFPDFELPAVTAQPIGRYGRMRKAYLEEHRPGLYERLILSGELYRHLEEIDSACRSRIETIVRKMARPEGLTEDFKASDQLGWVAKMNNIRHRAEETILAELVYD